MSLADWTPTFFKDPSFRVDVICTNFTGDIADFIIPEIDSVSIQVFYNVGFGFWRLGRSAGGNLFVEYDHSDGFQTYEPVVFPDSGEWSHIALVFNEDSNRLQFYVNGAAQAFHVPAAGTFTFENDPMIIGGAAGSVGFNGQIAEVSLWDDVVSQEAMDALAGGLAANEINPNLAGANVEYYWPLVKGIIAKDEKIGSGADLTENGTTTETIHPPITRRRRRRTRIF
jgi:hypothetical protein